MLKIFSQPKIEQLDAMNFARFAEYVHQRGGLYFPEKKRNDLSYGVFKAMESAGFSDTNLYYNHLIQDETREASFKHLISFLSIKETYFFRHFDVLKDHILPEFVNRNRNHRKLRIWSAGCATGEEPYSIIMVLMDLIPDLSSWDLLILATDVDMTAVQFAQGGIFRPWSLRSTPDYYKMKYFTRIGENYKITDDVKKWVHFQYLNLAEETYPSYATNTVDLDIILCRNVTIYFEIDTTMKTVQRFYNGLKDGGVLVVGHSEPSNLIYDQYKAEIYTDAVVYRKDSSVQQKKAPVPVLRTRQEVLIDRPKKWVEKPKSITKQVVKKEERRGKISLAELFESGMTAFRKNQFQNSLDIFQEVIKSDPINARAHYMIGYVYANQANFKEAISWCEKAISLDNLLLEAYYLLSIICKEEKRHEEAIDLLKKALYIDPNFVIGYYELLCNYVRIENHAEAKKAHLQINKILKKKDPNYLVGGLEGLTAQELQKLADIWVR